MSKRDFHVASWNIHKGVGTDRKRDLARTAKVIGEMNADIVALQEADTRFGTRTGLLDLHHLERETGLIPLPVKGVGPAHGWHGNLILAREADLDDLHQINLPGFEPRGALIADMTLSGLPMRVVAAHLGLLPGSRSAQVAAILDKLSGLEARPTLLMGDLNEWRTDARSSLAGLRGHLPQSPIVRSFPTRLPFVPFDRIMACDRSELYDVTTHDTPLARRASDHLPIRARLKVK